MNCTMCNYTLYNLYMDVPKKLKNKWKELIDEHLLSKKEYSASKNILYDV